MLQSAAVVPATIDAKLEAPRRVPGRPFIKGQSGNPNGRRGERKFNGKTLPELAREMTHEALQTVREVLHMPDASPGLRLQAADIVLRRGWGDAPRDPLIAAEGVEVVVQKLVTKVEPVPGVIASPIAGHVSSPRSTPKSEPVEQGAAAQVVDSPLGLVHTTKLEQ